jgi:hypothetical protein
MSAILLSSWTRLLLRLASLSWIELDESFEAGEFVLPESTVVLQPLIDFPERLRVEVIETMASIALLANQSGPTQQTEVFGNRGARDREGAGDLARWLAAAAKKVEHGPARGIGQGAEDAIARMSN